jgi:hypothetical protein
MNYLQTRYANRVSGKPRNLPGNGTPYDCTGCLISLRKRKISGQYVWVWRTMIQRGHAPMIVHQLLLDFLRGVMTFCFMTSANGLDFNSAPYEMICSHRNTTFYRWKRPMPDQTEDPPFFQRSVSIFYCVLEKRFWLHSKKPVDDHQSVTKRQTLPAQREGL